MNLWIAGETRDTIANITKLSGGSVSTIVDEWKRKVGAHDAESVRELAIELRKKGIKLADLIPCIRLYNIIKNSGINEDAVNDFVTSIQTQAITKSITPETMVIYCEQVLRTVESQGILPSEIQAFLSEKSTQKEKLEKEITDLERRKEQLERQIITTTRVLLNGKALSLAEVDDILVMNSHSVSEGERESYGRGSSWGSSHSSESSGRSYSERRTVGDVVFVRQGQPYIVFKQLPDPDGIVRLAMSARQSLLETMASKKNKKEEKITRITCPRCNTENLVDANFCNSCGQSLPSNVCRKCNTTNLPGSTFCSECGTPLA